MNDSVSYLKEEYRHQEASLKYEEPGKKGGSEPPGGSGLESRVTTIEKTVSEIKEKLAVVSGKVDSLEKHSATKADLATTELNLIKWYVATAFAMTGLASAITFGLTRLLAH